MAQSGRNVVVIGTQWGDEGKGKVVDRFSISMVQLGSSNWGTTTFLTGALYSMAWTMTSSSPSRLEAFFFDSI